MTNSPSAENLTIRLFPPELCPSATKMVPSGVTSTSDGMLNCPSAVPATPGSPSRISTSPSGLNLITKWPSPSGTRSSGTNPFASVTQTFPSWSTNIPCGQAIRPAPKLLSASPSGLNRTTVSTSGRSPQKFAPQRSAAQMLPSAAG